MKTILEVIQATSDYLARRRIEHPRLNAEHLIAHALGKKRLDLYLEFDRLLSESELAPMRRMVRARGDGAPLEHLLGTSEFFGRSFRCDARALIPRPETEELVELVLAEFRERAAQPLRIVDVGTGSGVIAVTLAIELPAAEVHATDRSPSALELAAENARLQRVEGRVEFHEADLLPADAGEFSLIVANLPYIPTGEISGLAAEVRNDPKLALDGGADGLDVIRRLITAAPNSLARGGRIVLEVGHDQACAVAKLCAAGGFRSAVIHRDLRGVERFVRAEIE